MKSKIIAFSFIATMAVLFTRCDYLDIVPDNTVEVNSLFENRDRALMYWKSIILLCNNGLITLKIIALMAY